MQKKARKETIERSFAESKELHCQRYCHMRGLAEVEEQSLLTAAGHVNPIPGGELSRGRGGPRCMSMPMLREEIWK